MKLNALPKTVSKSLRRVGRGHGSGRVKTSGRGTKGQKARNTVRPGFEGGQLPLILRLPLYRGRYVNRSRAPKVLAIDIKELAVLPKDTEVTMETLLKHDIVSKNAAHRNVKILGSAEIANALTIKVPISQSAAKAIEAAGGKIIRPVVTESK